jgi:acyl-CoA thioester hydrolase
MELKSQYTIRFNDCDPFNHLNNSSYIDYMLNAREDHLKTHYGIDLPSYYAKGIGWVVGSHEIVYVSPAIYNEVVSIHSEILEIHEDYFWVEIRMYNQSASKLKALMRTKFITVNMQTGKKDVPPTEFLEKINALEYHNKAFETNIQLRVSEVINKLRLEILDVRC